MMKWLSIVWLGVSLMGIVSCAHTDLKCCNPIETKEEKAEEIRRFESFSFEYAGIRHDCLVTRAKQPGKGAVLLLHEMPSLSVSVLELARRMAAKGYDVYVPDLWDSQQSSGSRAVFVKNAIVLPLSKGFRLDLSSVPSRRIVDWLSGLCREVIVKQHPGERIGCVGLCVTGVFPVMLAGLVPEIAAPVVCQPSLLRLPLGDEVKADIGMSKAEVKLVRSRMEREPDFQILAFRFEHDNVSPAERLNTLIQCFPGRVLDGTLKAENYYGRDKLPLNAHAILTDCYVAPRGGKKVTETHRAFVEMMEFMDAKLKGSQPRRYVPSGGALVREVP
ncbi:hypothetical protein FEM03_16185 [Phragmitibacter flavus]|uniref:Dienelactone hydrolase domain-containing protein n=1 Tax=Phragmitibacter flavus TaxID=2576071 RepID=A0A5R8KC97_9BACT|nr:dienelactone hydrolase family protein [Phragmitibacter flavus]TLD69857.1 hypothetical protein FEM03_16185 [Phragmitibacter flavus]